MPRAALVTVVVEAGAKRVFASALEWPGWSRAGRTEEEALQTLKEYSSRYASVAGAAGLAFPGANAVSFDIVERAAGSATTDFGVPGEVARADTSPVSAAQARRLCSLVRASWTVLDTIASVTPPELRKGPRGGGRDRDRILDHILGAEAVYVRKLGIKHPQPAIDDIKGIASLRDAITGALSDPSDGSPLAPKGWPARYAVRRIAWHVLDHAWEMEDRRDP